MQPTTGRIGATLAGFVLAMGLFMAGTAPAWAGRAFRHSSGFGFHRHAPHHRFFPGHFAWHPYHHYSPYAYFGFYDAGAPYAYSTTPGEYRRLPAFRLPGFFSYPGALGKEEGLALPAVSDTTSAVPPQ
jgi:hypothetical protein